MRIYMLRTAPEFTLGNIERVDLYLIIGCTQNSLIDLTENEAVIG